MTFLAKKWEGHTYLKYILSYLLIVMVLILGFFFIIRDQLTARFFRQRSEQLQLQLTNASEWLNSNFEHLSLVESTLDNAMILDTSLYTNKNSRKYHAYQELQKFDGNVQLINSIVYKFENYGDIISTQYVITYDGNAFYIRNASSALTTIAFDPTPYLGSNLGKLILVSDESIQYLIYFPPTKTLEGAVSFFILDTSEIEKWLENIMTDEVSAVALIDGNRQLAVDVNGEMLMPYIDSFELSSGIHALDDSNSVCVQTGIYSGFSMVALISQDSLTSQVNAAFANSYMTLMLLCVVGLLLVLFSMSMTYLPLHRLTRKLLPDAASGHDHLEQLETVFTRTEEQNQMLTEKLDGYRLFMQKSLLDSLVASHSPGENTVSPNIDQFFDIGSNKEIFLIQMASPAKPLPYSNIQTYFQEVLPGNDSCIILEAKQNSVTFLINYMGLELNKDEVLKELLNNYYEEEGYLSAISNGTDSPLDIPSLYENVMQASSYWPEVPVVTCKSLPPATTAFNYPYTKLHELSELLNEKDFSEAKTVTGDIFRVISGSVRSENNLPDFFVRCILVDMLTAIANCMNKDNIAFDSYEDLYTETLYFCRNCPYTEKEKEISDNIYHLIDVYEQQIANRALTPAQVIQLMETSYAEPDFSIALLADKCHVSIAYMSYLIKKELNQSFSEYLWALRLEKAKELLSTTDMPIDEISVAVGYLNSSSFRRKFKQETGLTPSQFRTQK